MDLLNWLRNEWDRVGAWIAISVGAIALVIGWVGVSRTPFTAEQIPYVMSGGLGGLFLLGLGATLWLSADLRDEWRVLDHIRRNQDVARDAEGTPPAPVADQPTGGAPRGTDASVDGASAKPRRRAPARPRGQ